MAPGNLSARWLRIGAGAVLIAVPVVVAVPRWEMLLANHPAYPIALTLTAVIGVVLVVTGARAQDPPREGAVRTALRFAAALGAVGIAAVLYWFAPFVAAPEALVALESDDAVQVTDTRSSTVFVSGTVSADDAGNVPTFVLYPGARVDPRAYARLSQQDRYGLARLIGRLAHSGERESEQVLALVGPGRWGTTTPSLGIPVSFAEIDTASILCEVVSMGGDLVPDVSLGTHFFNDLIESDILYLALFPERDDHQLGQPAIEAATNVLGSLVPDATQWEPIVRVIDPATDPALGGLVLHADSLAQHVLCYWGSPGQTR